MQVKFLDSFANTFKFQAGHEFVAAAEPPPPPRYSRSGGGRYGGGHYGTYGGGSIATFVNAVPKNPLEAMMKKDMLAVIFVSILVGFALTRIESTRSELIVKFLEGVNLIAEFCIWARANKSDSYAVKIEQHMAALPTSGPKGVKPRWR